MKSRLFYSHLIETESLTIELDKLSLEDEQRLHLAKLIDSTLHHTILDAILSELSNNDKRLFIKYLEEDDDNKIWQFLNNRIKNIEEKIKIAGEILKEEMHKDLSKAKKEATTK
jgi:hypothetical protein